MKYKEILRRIAKKEGVSVKRVETEMRQALILAGISSSPKEFIENVSSDIKKRLYIV